MNVDFNQDIYFLIRPDLRQHVGQKSVFDTVLMLFAEEGSARIRIENEEYVSDRAHMLFLHPRVEISPAEVSADYRCVLVGIPHVMQEAVILQMDFSFIRLLFKKPSWELDDKLSGMAQSFCNMFEFVCQDLDSDVKTDLIISLFVFFMKVLYERMRFRLNTEAETPSMNNRTLMSRFGKQLRLHFREDHRVIYYADLLCVSTKYLTQVVKSTVGVTPKDIIDRLLAMESLHQLKHSNLTLQQISEKLGFPDQSYFGRFFKKNFGISPTQYRQNPTMDILHKLDEHLYLKYPNLRNLEADVPLKDFSLKESDKE